MLNISNISKSPIAFQKTVTLPPETKASMEYEYDNESDLYIPIDVEKTEEYTEDDYNQDKSFLEKSKQDVENIVNTVDAPKPVKTFMKFILGGISVAMGFMSMKWGTLASWKVAENVITNPKTQKIVSGIKKPLQNGYQFVTDTIKDSKMNKQVSGAVDETLKKLGKTTIGTTINNWATKVKKTDLYTSISNKLAKVNVTTQKVKNYTANFFGVSGGVTAGVETIQSNSRNQADDA